MVPEVASDEGELVIALTPAQLGAVLAVLLVVFVPNRARSARRGQVL